MGSLLHRQVQNPKVLRLHRPCVYRFPLLFLLLHRTIWRGQSDAVCAPLCNYLSPVQHGGCNLRRQWHNWRDYRPGNAPFLLYADSKENQIQWWLHSHVHSCSSDHNSWELGLQFHYFRRIAPSLLERNRAAFETGRDASNCRYVSWHGLYRRAQNQLDPIPKESNWGSLQHH